MHILSPYLTFAPIGWWVVAMRADTVVLDGEEAYRKMTWRNRYRIGGANNAILLSAPLVAGRKQHSTMAEVLLSYQQAWQVQHWRTLVSVYRRSPFFDHYEPSLQPLFETRYEHLIDFNLASTQWVLKQLKAPFALHCAAPEPGLLYDADLRMGVPELPDFPKYYQVFEDRIGFQPGLSILDLLFSEGPAARRWLLDAANQL